MGEALRKPGALHVNTVLWLGGVLDIASEAGIDRRQQDFGLTLGHWGVPTGPYLVLPCWGPSTVRDTALCRWTSNGNLLGQPGPVETSHAIRCTACACRQARQPAAAGSTARIRRRWTPTASRATCTCRCAVAMSGAGDWATMAAPNIDSIDGVRRRACYR